jgi:hypothetical protein
MIIVGSFLPEPFWLVSATNFTRVCKEPALLWNQLHQLCWGNGIGPKQVGESLRERGKAKLKSAGESHSWHRAMAIEKEVGTLSPHQLHHSPGHGKEPGAMKGVREYFGELATGNRIGTGADEWACNSFLIQGV